MPLVFHPVRIVERETVQVGHAAFHASDRFEDFHSLDSAISYLASGLEHGIVHNGPVPSVEPLCTVSFLPLSRIREHPFQLYDTGFNEVGWNTVFLDLQCRLFADENFCFAFDKAALLLFLRIYRSFPQFLLLAAGKESHTQECGSKQMSFVHNFSGQKFPKYTLEGTLGISVVLIVWLLESFLRRAFQAFLGKCLACGLKADLRTGDICRLDSFETEAGCCLA